MKRKTFYSLIRRSKAFFREAVLLKPSNPLESVKSILKSLFTLLKLTSMRLEETQKKLRKLSRKKTCSSRRQKKVKKLSENLQSILTQREEMQQEEARFTEVLRSHVAHDIWKKKQFNETSLD